MSMTTLGPAEIGRRLYKSERVHTAIEHPSLITAEHMRQYWTDGFIGERLIGASLRLSQDMALLKPPHIGREKPWHQDTAYFNLQPFDGVLGTWTALDAATPENGCMHVIPGSHLRGPHRMAA